MDLIWLDENLVEQGVIETAEFNSEIGEYYDFTFTVPKSMYSVLAGMFVYPRGAFEFGGKIVSCSSSSREGFVTFTGVTWIGILGLHQRTTFQYSSNVTQRLYLYADSIIRSADVDLASLIVSNSSLAYALDNPATIPEPEGNVYNMLTIWKSLYKQAAMVPVLVPKYYSSGKMYIDLTARPTTTYNARDFSSDVFPIEVEKQLQPVTKIGISYMQSNNTPATTKYKIMDASGTWHDAPYTEVFNGFRSRSAALMLKQDEYNNPDWDAIIESVQVKDSADVSFDGQLDASIGDIVTAKDVTTGIEATETVSSKSLNLVDGVPIFSFETA